MKRLLARGTALVVATAAMLVPMRVGACSLAEPEPFDEILSSGSSYSVPITGFYEQQHIAYTPGAVVRGPRSSSVVTRYWGTSPDLRVASHGSGGFLVGFLTGGGCGDNASPLGVTSIHVSTERSADYARGSLTGVELADRSYPQQLSVAEEAALVDRFGPATQVSLGPDDYLVGYALILWRPSLGLTALIGAGYALRGRVRRIRRERPGRGNLGVVAAAVAGVSAITVAIGHFGSFHWLGMLAGVAGSIGAGYLARTFWAIVGPAVVLWAGSAGYILAGARPFDDARMHAGISLLIVGVGALVWARNHWTRWPATATVVAGSFVLTFGALEYRGYVDAAKLGLAATAVATAAGAAIWLLVYRPAGLIKRPGVDSPLDGIAAPGPPPPSQ